MEKAFEPSQFEARLYKWWENSGFFGVDENSKKPPFMIAMPPPNVTGALHNGHALFVTIQDALVRWKRMSGYNALWMPGTDHAGIATQMVVERELAKESFKNTGKKLSRHDLGREKFIEKVWEWKNKHGNMITTQMRKLGGSPDWKRERFTMDDGLSVAVREAFVSFYEQGLLYRGQRIINWCPRCQTALSDLEVVPKERKGNFWHLKYAIEGTNSALVIATTRPETLLGDTAVAVHPEDERYKNIIGKKVKLPLIGRFLPVIADEYVDKEFGSGALKVTPGHDFNDYDLGVKHQLQVLSVFNKTGRVNELGKPYSGLTVTEAREKIVKDLQEAGLLVKVEDHTHSVGVCDRCETIVEPMISEQWFLIVQTMAQNAIRAVRKGDSMSLSEVDARDDAIKIVPESWSTTFYNWMENIRDWCVSRQLWWGHQIPAWYCEQNHITVSRNTPSQCSDCGSTKLIQDPDVLDTWFSSGLWPFSTLGWPEQTEMLKTFYPTAIMETGFDILFFWVARMIMMGMHFNEGKVPFKRVYLHAMVRDEKGQKMSKTKGNVIDPLDIISEYGADAFRFTLSVMAGQGRDVKLSFERIEGYKAFCNKLWNASRYVLIRIGHVHAEGVSAAINVKLKELTSKTSLREYLEKESLHPINQWILSRLAETVKAVNSGLEEFKLNESAQSLYTFVWNEYCDWYIEFSKILLENKDTAQQTAACLLYVLEEMLKLSHPFIPFVTEEIFQNLPERGWMKKGASLMMQHYPHAVEVKHNEADVQKVESWKKTIELLRAFRGENSISPKIKPRASYDLSSNPSFVEGLSYIQALTQFEEFTKETGTQRGLDTVAEVLGDGVKFYIPMQGIIDVAAELKRVEKTKKDLEKDIELVKSKLAKPTFIEKAPAELVSKEKERLIEFEQKLKEVEKTHARLQKLS